MTDKKKPVSGALKYPTVPREPVFSDSVKKMERRHKALEAPKKQIAKIYKEREKPVPDRKKLKKAHKKLGAAGIKKSKVINKHYNYEESDHDENISRSNLKLQI